MTPYETGENMKAAQQARGGIGGATMPQANQGKSAIGCCVGADNATGTPLAIYRLQYQRETDHRKSQLLDRVIDILTRHPEFEEFLEVMRSGLV